MKSRNTLLAILVTLVLAACSTPAAASSTQTEAAGVTQSADQTQASDATAPVQGSEQPKEIRIGYQRNGVWPLIKAKGTLEKRFPGTTITWSVFTAGPPLLEALNANSIDVGFTGATPPIFAQAAGTPLVYVGVISGSGAGSAVLVP